MAKGMMVYVYKNECLNDCTSKGLTHDKERVILTGKGVVELFEGVENNSDVLELNIKDSGYIYAAPLVQPKGMNGPMFGGNFIYTSDSRFPSKYPIPVHDRFESW